MEKSKPKKSSDPPKLIRHKDTLRIFAPEKRKTTIEKFKKSNIPIHYNESPFFKK